MARALRLGVLLALVLALIPASAGAADLDVSFTVVREGPTSVTIRATISGATGPIQATARVEPLRDGEPVPTVRGLRVDAVERVSEYRHTPLEETKRIPIAEAMTALDAEITALRDTKGLKSEEIDARREERHGKETELAALRSQADHGATFTETTAVVAHEYRLATRERRALVAHCNAGDTITLPPQSWAAPPPSQLLSDTELSLSPTETNWGESTAVYEWTISTGELRRADGTWGSAGVLVVNVNGRDYYDTENSSWWDSSWPYRMKLTIDKSASAENLIDFPLLVKLTPARFDYSFAQVDGDDIRFVDADGTALDYEVDTWTLDGESFFWVRVPQIDALSTTDYIWMYWGTPTVANGENAEGVWNHNYVAVYHMNDDGAGTGILDSTSNSNDGTKGAGAAAPTEVAGTVGKAQQFYGTAGANYINVPYNASLQVGNDLSVLVLWKPEGAAFSESYKGGVGRASYKPNYSWALMPTTGGTGQAVFAATLENNTTQLVLSGEGSLAVGSWAVIAGGVIPDSELWVSVNGGARVTAARVGGYYHTTMPLEIGSRESGFRVIEGPIDEVRLSSVALSGEWIEAEYLSMWDALLTYGDTEGYEPPAVPADVLPLESALLLVGVGAAAVWRKHLILYVAAFVLYLFSGMTLMDESLVLGIPVVLYAGYYLFATTQLLWRR